SGFVNAVLNALKATHKLNYTYRSLNEKSKSYIWVNVQGKSIPQEDGTQYVYVIYTDISSDKKIERRLRESEQSLETAAEAAEIWYWVHDWENDIGYVGKRVQKEYHLPHKINHFLKRWLRSEIIDPSYHAQFLARIKNVQQGERQECFDCRIYVKDGTSHWVRFLLKRITDENGSECRMIGIARIIDDIKSLEEKYEVEKKRGLLSDENLLAHALFNLSRNETLEYAGKNAIFGDMKDISFEILGENIAKDIDNVDQKEKYLAIHDRTALLKKYEEGENEVLIDYRRKMPGGKVIWVRSMYHMMREPDGTDILLFDYCYDINRQKTMEIMMDFAVNDDYDLLGSVNFHDNSAIMLFGKNSYNVTGSDYVEEDYTKSLLRLVKNAVVEEEKEEYYKKACIENIREKLQKMDSYEFNFRMIKNGEERIKKVRYVRYDKEGNICLWNQIDVTLLMQEEQRKQEELKKALAEAEYANKSKTVFLSQMSHEIRTPMNAILGMTQLAKDSIQMQEKDEYLEKIDSSSRYLLGIINDILDMSRIESGKFELHPAWIPANEVFCSCVDMLKPEMIRKGIHFIYPEAKRINEVEYYVDALRVQQVHMNLLNNAMKFTPPGGTVRMEIKNISHDDRVSIDRITISDTGCGMSEEFLTRIFRPFEQEQNPFSDMVQGTGLGLALVKQILTAMGGNIEVKSKLGEGSTFSFSFPYQYRYVKENKIPKQDIKKYDLNNRRVLLVDDRKLNRQIARKLLEKKGVLVEEAVDGAQAVNMFEASEKNYYDLILMDIRMPVLDGLGATRKIRALDRKDAGEVAIIAMTANAFDEDVKASLDAGMNAHLAKPIEPQLMYETIGNILNENNV
ncbi:MAG: PAS domain-containing sensor histidine kinase, partial [Clostridia bacterium]|nr:PAS domain-containing sensor histidine kinase [Clostridia bacterium]